MKYYIDENNNPFVFENNASDEIIKSIEKKHNVSLTKITKAKYVKISNPEPSVEEVREKKINELKQACGREITSGFISNALGRDYYYQSEQIDQLNLIGVVLAGVDDVFKCSVDNVVWEYKLHTITQLKQVLEDGKKIKQGLLAKLEGLKASVKTTKKADIESIKWS